MARAGAPPPCVPAGSLSRRSCPFGPFSSARVFPPRFRIPVWVVGVGLFTRLSIPPTHTLTSFPRFGVCRCGGAWGLEWALRLCKKPILIKLRGGSRRLSGGRQGVGKFSPAGSGASRTLETLGDESGIWVRGSTWS